jgi:RNA-directed DNA polymerase
VISPALLNVALHGMEQAAGVRYHLLRGHAPRVDPGCPVLVRYADLCRARHKSAYAESRIMPTRPADALVRATDVFPVSA